MACMCGDTQCPSCGPAQGNWRCPICRAWADDECEHLEVVACPDCHGRPPARETCATCHGCDSIIRLKPEFQAHAREIALLDTEPLYIRPLEFSWLNDWVPRIRTNKSHVLTLLKVAIPGGIVAASATIDQFNRETDEWLRSLSDNKKLDVVALLLAECDMLCMMLLPDQGKTPPSDSDEGMDFRQRFHEALPLAIAADRVQLHRAGIALRAFRLLEQRAEKEGWLP